MSSLGNLFKEMEMRGVIFLKPQIPAEDSIDIKYLENIKSQLKKPSNIKKITQEIRRVKAELSGEARVRRALSFSNCPMYVIPDLFLRHEYFEAQIDFLIITPDKIYQIECKNTSSEVRITQDSKFVIKTRVGEFAINSPAVRADDNKKVIKSVITSFDNEFINANNFDEKYETIVVMTHENCKINKDKATHEMKNIVKTVEELRSSIKVTSKKLMSHKEMKYIADIFQENDATVIKKGLKRYYKMLESEKISPSRKK